MSESVAIVHDWLTSMRGGERVVEALYGVFPHADLFTLTWDPERLSPSLAKKKATTSVIHRMANAPFVSGRFRALLPLFPRAVESFNLDRYGLVVSSSHCVALGAKAPANALHVAYLHSTMRYTREGQPAYESRVPGGRLGRTMFRGTAHYLRRWELEASARPHVLIANSSYTRERIRRYYERDAEVIEPPVETSRFREPLDGEDAGDDAPFLVVSALVPNKRVDLAMRAFQGRRERLIVVGDGPERDRLEPLVGPNVTLLPRVSEDELARLFAGCRALVHPAVDDFGMVMVEALAAGKPVIACAEGGALDIVHDGLTGLLMEEATTESLRKTLDRFAVRAHAQGFDAPSLRAFAHRFDRSHFERRFAAAVDDARGRHRPAHPTSGRTRVAPVRPPRHRPLTFLPVASPSIPALAPQAPRSHGKRAFDVMFAAAGLLASAPLLCTFAAAIAFGSKGSPLFFQRRTGRGAREFTMVKLRTMNRSGQVTPIGQWLRPLGLDEIPQLWNVLTGDMSVIGPRPEVPDRVARYRRDLSGYDERHAVRPGITGLAQVRGLRGDHTGTIAERLRFDVQYVRDWSLGLDANIMLETFPRVLRDTLRALKG